jgi:predicted nucleic acid-binding protein
MSNTSLLSFPFKLYKEIINARKNLNLDFDDAYQYRTAKYYELKIVTMDKDFEKIEDVDILFI